MSGTAATRSGLTRAKNARKIESAVGDEGGPGAVPACPGRIDSTSPDGATPYFCVNAEANASGSLPYCARMRSTLCTRSGLTRAKYAESTAAAGGAVDELALADEPVTLVTTNGVDGVAAVVAMIGATDGPCKRSPVLEVG